MSEQLDQPDQHDEPVPWFKVGDIVIDHDADKAAIFMGTVTDFTWIEPVYCYDYDCEYFTYNLKGSNTIWIEVDRVCPKLGAEHLLEKVGRAADEIGEGGESQWPQQGIVANSKS